jgi:hypothetical protein
VVAGAAVLLALLLWHPSARIPEEAVPTPGTVPSPPSRPSPAPTPSPAATPPGADVTRHSSVLVQWRPEPSPTPPPAATATPRSWPPPTPPVEDCVHIVSISTEATAPVGQVLVKVVARNECGRTLPPLEVWFEVVGFHDGGPVSTARGHPFEAVDPGDETHAVIGLPGSADWMPRITVRVLPLS